MKYLIPITLLLLIFAISRFYFQQKKEHDKKIYRQEFQADVDSMSIRLKELSPQKEIKTRIQQDSIYQYLSESFATTYPDVKEYIRFEDLRYFKYPLSRRRLIWDNDRWWKEQSLFDSTYHEPILMNICTHYPLIMNAAPDVERYYYDDHSILTFEGLVLLEELEINPSSTMQLWYQDTIPLSSTMTLDQFKVLFPKSTAAIDSDNKVNIFLYPYGDMLEFYFNNNYLYKFRSYPKCEANHPPLPKNI